MMNELCRILEREALLGEEAEARITARIEALDVQESPLLGTSPVQIYLRSLAWRDEVVFGIARFADRRWRLLFAAAVSSASFAVRDRIGSLQPEDDEDGASGVVTFALTGTNARAIHDLFPWSKPRSLRTHRTTIGMGDRLGVATAGHLRAARGFAIAPVLAQQSVRENDFIGRAFPDVVANATWGVFREGFRDGYGADGDHLKNIPSIDVALSAGMPMVTLDLTEVMRPEVADWSGNEVAEAFETLDSEFRARVEREYAGKEFVIGPKDAPTRIRFGAGEAERCAVMYGPALDFSREVDAHLDRATGGAYDLEISIDETSTPTLPAHHLFIARELQKQSVLVNSLAPRFIGEFQKAIDYIGDHEEFDRQFRVHCTIAKEYGAYKVSIHSGSDKFSVYPTIGRETDRRLHLKTSGTSWLEALKVIADYDPALYRRVHAFAIEYYPTALTFYHITADFEAIAPLDTVSDADLSRYLEDANARRMLHISYGGILGHPELGPALYDSLFDHEEEYAEILRVHFTKHIGLLGIEPRQ